MVGLQCLKGSHKGDGCSVFKRSHMEKTRSKRYKLLQERFCLTLTMIFFTERTIILWNNLLKDMVESP